MPRDPISSGPAGSDLQTGLADLEARLRAFGAPIAAAFRPGAAPDRVRAALVAEGLAPHEDLVTWWGWHNGAEIDAPPLEPGPTIFLGGENTLLGPWHVLSLSEALRLRRWLLEVHSAPLLEQVFPRSWVPILTTDAAGELCADTSGAGPASLHLRDEGYFGVEPPKFSSLSDLVECMVQVFDLGQVVPDPMDPRAPCADAAALTGDHRRLAFW